jgi:hypothetical protein
MVMCVGEWRLKIYIDLIDIKTPGSVVLSPNRGYRINDYCERVPVLRSRLERYCKVAMVVRIVVRMSEATDDASTAAK